MKPLNEKTKMPKKAVRVESKKGVIEKDFVTLGADCAEIGEVTAIRSNISEVDVDAYYIKKIDEGKEKCVYLRKIGNETRVFFVEKKSEGHIPFTPYAFSEFSLNEMLLGRDRRASGEDFTIADRKIGENELEYISMFMPENHQLKRKKGISMALTNDEKYKFMAFYWKNGKSVPCANSSYIPVLFDALETVTFNNASLTSPEQAADEIALDTDEEDENEPNLTEETAESEQETIIIPEESDSKTEKPAEEAGEIVSESEESASVSIEEAAEQSAEAEPEEKPEKESLFEKRRKKKQLKKEQKANKKAKKAEKSKEEHSKEKEEIKQTEEIAKSPAETDEEEISAEESEALAAAMPTDLFSEQELEDIFDNPFEDEIAEAEEAEQGETENQPEEEDDIAAESEEPKAENEEETPEQAKEKKPEKEGFFERRHKKKLLKKAQKENDEKAQKHAEVAEETQPAEEPEQIAETESVASEAKEVEIPSQEEEHSESEQPEKAEEIAEEEQPEEAEEIEADLPEQAEQPQQAEPENEEASEENAASESEQTNEVGTESEEEPETKSEKSGKSAKKGSLFAKKSKKKKAKKQKTQSAEGSEEEIDLESAQTASKDEEPENKFSVEEFFESEKPLTLLQILDAADINNENKKSFLPYMIPALMNTVYIVPITDSGENAGAVYVSKKAADLLVGQDFPTGKGKELIMPGDERENLRKGIKIKTIMSSGEAFIPAFTSAEMFEQIFGKNERAGLFTFPNLRSQVKKTAQIKGIIINPEITDLKLGEKEI